MCPWINDIEQNFPIRQTIIRDNKYLSTLSKEDQEEFDFMGVIQTKETYERFRRDIKPYLPLANQEFLLRLNYCLTFDLTAHYDFPTSFIEARQDHAAGYEGAFQLVKNFPRASYSIIDCAGHNIQLERVRIFEELVNEWLERTKE